MTTHITICNSALLLIGAEQIESFEDETREAEACARLYPGTLDELLRSHPWNFTKEQVQLSKLVETPLFGYAYVYQLPPQSLDVIRMVPGYPYEILGDKLYTDADPVQIEHKIRPSESKLPPDFVRALEFEMAALLALALRSDRNLFADMMASATAKKQQAKAANDQQQPNAALDQQNFMIYQARL